MEARVAGETLEFEGWRFDPQKRLLFRGGPGSTWLPIPLSSRALDTLALLLEDPGTLVSKDTIMAAVWPETTVESNNLTVQMSMLRRALDKGRSDGSCIQTVQGRGYRFTAAVKRLAEPASTSDQRMPAATPPASNLDAGRARLGGRATDAGVRHRLRTLLRALISPLFREYGADGEPTRPGAPRVLVTAAALAGILLLGAGGAGLWLHRYADALTDRAQVSSTPQRYTPPDVGLSNAPRLSIAVLPFTNLGGDPKDEYLAAGITDDVTTELSRVRGMFVIARESAYTYQGKAVDVRRIGEELGVRYVLEGSARRFGDTLRINAQLIGTETNADLWADRFDENLTDLSAGQEEIVSRIGQTLNVALTDLESARGKRERPANPDAFDLILRARALSLRPQGPGERAQRIALLEQAVGLDPNSVEAMTQLALELTIMERMYSHAGDLDRAADLIARAAAIDPDDRMVLHTTAYLLFAQYRDSEALAAWQHLLTKYPNAAPVYGLMADCLVHMGRPAEAIPVLEMALRRDPRSPYVFDRFDAMGTALQMLGKDKEAIPWIERALASVRTSDNHHRAMFGTQLAAEYAQLGKLEDARVALAEAVRLWPYYTVRGNVPSNINSPMWTQLYRRDQALFRLIGMRDHADEDADFGVPADNDLRSTISGLTPTSVPGATTIRTGELGQLLRGREVLVIDTFTDCWGQSLAGAVALKNAGHGGSTSDAIQGRLRKKMQELTKGDFKTPIVAVGWNSEHFDGRNLAIRLAALGYTNVYWYRGGREAWEVAGLPETDVDMREW